MATQFGMDDFCFACGPANPIGLKLKIQPHPEGGAVAHFTAAREYQGYEGVLHGGIAATLVDEVMVWASFFQGLPVVTGTLTVKYRRPVPVGEPLEIRGWVLEASGRRVRARAEIRHQGRVLVSAESLMLRVPVERHDSAV